MTTEIVPPRVLLVDDSVVVRRVLSLVLRQMPAFVYAFIDEAANGALALRKLEEGRYDLVLSDVRMPGLDGLSMLRHVRTVMNDAATPVILISTLGREEDIKAGFEAGATGYICKPIVPTEIRIALQEILTSRLGYPARLL